VVRNHPKRRERNAQFVSLNSYAVAFHVHRVCSGGSVEKLPLVSMKHRRVRGSKAHNAVTQVLASHCVSDPLHKEFRRGEHQVGSSRVHCFRRNDKIVHSKFRHQGP